MASLHSLQRKTYRHDKVAAHRNGGETLFVQCEGLVEFQETTLDRSNSDAGLVAVPARTKEIVVRDLIESVQSLTVMVLAGMLIVVMLCCITTGMAAAAMLVA